MRRRHRWVPRRSPEAQARSPRPCGVSSVAAAVSRSTTFAVKFPMQKHVIMSAHPFHICAMELRVELTSFIGANDAADGADAAALERQRRAREGGVRGREARSIAARGGGGVSCGARSAAASARCCMIAALPLEAAAALAVLLARRRRLRVVGSVGKFPAQEIP